MPFSGRHGATAHAEQGRAVQVLSEENARLSGLLEFKRDRWPRA